MSDAQAPKTSTDGREGAPRRRRSDGERSRAAILRSATDIATVEGLEGLSIGRLAEHVGMSKSGLFAHFRSKEDLQLATIETAQEIFTREVYEPGLEGSPGVARVEGLCAAFLSYVERRVFPGGCFFAATATELATREGPLTERIRDFYADWLRILAGLVDEARELGELAPDTDTDQLCFELDALLLGANLSIALFSDPKATQRADQGIRRLLAQPPP